MTEKMIFFSDVLKDSSIWLGLTSDISMHNIDAAIAIAKKNLAGDSLPSSAFPDAIFGDDDSKNFSKLPSFFLAGSFWCVSRPCADVLRKFDMGGGSLYPVRVFQKDRKTPVEGEYFCINFGSVKHAFVPELSPSAKENPFRKGFWMVGLMPEHGGMTVTTEALEGPDLWIDSGIHKALFASGRLVAAMEEAGVGDVFRWHRCRIVDEV